MFPPKLSSIFCTNARNVNFETLYSGQFTLFSIDLCEFFGSEKSTFYFRNVLWEERSRIFAVLAGPTKVASKVGKRCGVVLGSRSLH